MAKGKRLERVNLTESAPISGVVDLRPKRAPIDWEEAKRLYTDEGLSFAEIARRFKSKPAWIRTGLEERGVEPRKTEKLPDQSRMLLYRIWNHLRSKIAAYIHAHGGRTPRNTSDMPWPDFSAFREWAVSRGFRPGMAVVRTDESKPFAHDNCEVVTREVERRLRIERHPRAPRSSVVAFGETKGVCAWTRDPRCVVSKTVLVRRLAAGVPPEIAITSPIGESFGHGTPTTKPQRRIDLQAVARLREQGCSIRDIAAKLGFSYEGIHAALRRGGLGQNRDGWTSLPEGRRLNQIWSQLRGRCEKARNGAPGIRPDPTMTVCAEWERFEPFLEFALNSNWKPGLSIVRVDRSKPYSPENCVFVTRQQASQRKRVPIGKVQPKVLITAFGETKGLSEWTKDPRCTVGISGLSLRLRRGWKPEDAITRAPVTPGYGGEYHRNFTAFGETKSLAEWQRDPRCRVAKAALGYRLEHGASFEEALTTPPFEWKDDFESRDA